MLESASLDLAVIGNCQVSALIDREGSIVWACWPRPDADPIFCALLNPAGRDAARGILAVELRGKSASQQSYIRNTAVVTTRLTDLEGGEVLITVPESPGTGTYHGPTPKPSESAHGSAS